MRQSLIICLRGGSFRHFLNGKGSLVLLRSSMTCMIGNVIERHKKQYLASASARSEAKDKWRDQGNRQSSGASNGSGTPKETVRKKGVPMVLLREIVLLRVTFSILAGLVSFVERWGTLRRIVQRKSERQQVVIMGGVHWLQLIQWKQQSRVIHCLVLQTHSHFYNAQAARERLTL